MPKESLRGPGGRVRLHDVVPLVVRRGRACGKSTTPGPMVLAPFKAGGRVGWTPRTRWIDNLVLYEWGAVVGNLLLRAGLNYGIAGMYLEFENVASPGDTVSPPALTRDADQGVSYYNQLVTSGTRDYLRVPLIAGVMNTSSLENFPKGNVPTFFAQTSGVVGVHGKPFSDVNNSVVYGGALVSFVDDSDFTQDLVFSRFYLGADEQQPKLPTSQVGVEWQLKLK